MHRQPSLNYRIIRIFFVIILCFSILFQLRAGSDGYGSTGPLADSITEQQRDSMLFSLNLVYLNGVNDHKTPFELISVLEELLDLDPSQYNHWFSLGLENIKIHEYHRAIDALDRGLALYPIEDNPTLVQIYISLSFCYHKINKHQKEKEILLKASQLHKDHPGVIGRYTICAHSRMRYKEAEYHSDRLVRILEERGLNAAEVAFYLGRLYLNTDYLEAEKHFRLAYQYDPANIEKLGALAWVLIINALKIDEGMSLIEQAIEADPQNAIFIHQQGYGFYVKGNYEDALFNLYNARQLYQQYSYELDNHIRLVEDAIASLEE